MFGEIPYLPRFCSVLFLSISVICLVGGRRDLLTFARVKQLQNNQPMWFIAFSLLPLLGLTYVCWHIYQLLPLASMWRWGVVVMFVLAFLTIFLNFSRTIDRMPLSLATVVYEVGNSSIFILLYLVMLFLLLDVGRLLHFVPRWIMHDNFATFGIIILLMVGIFGYGSLNYAHKVRRALTLTTSKPIERPQKIVMLSDLHLGYHNRRAEMAHWVDIINQEKPDLILIGGDIIDISVRPLMEEDVASEFRRLRAPIYACLGNHEYFSGELQAQQFYHDASIRLLRDASVSVNGLTIIGRDDRTNPHRQNLKVLARQADMSRYTILLDHQPYHLEQAEHAGIDFQFSGHTHHGQVWPISWITERLYECAFGAWTRGRTFYYVSSGMGIWGGKFRIGTCSEYVVVSLQPATR